MRAVLYRSQEVRDAVLRGPTEVGDDQGIDHLAELVADLLHPT